MTVASTSSQAIMGLLFDFNQLVDFRNHQISISTNLGQSEIKSWMLPACNKAVL